MKRNSFLPCEWGATFSEVLIALTLTIIGMVGAMGAFQRAGETIGQGTIATRALALAESRLEAKRSIRWDRLLLDDLDHDGRHEIMMQDDGRRGDRIAGDGIYSAEWERDGLRVNWTVAPNRPGPLSDSSFVLLEAQVSYVSNGRTHELRLATIRANPVFAGGR